jgi:hypothetical protein
MSTLGNEYYAPPPLPPPAPVKKKRKWPWIVAGVVLFLFVVGSIGNSGQGNQNKPTPTSAAAKPTSAAPATPPRNLPPQSDGVYPVKNFASGLTNPVAGVGGMDRNRWPTARQQSLQLGKAIDADYHHLRHYPDGSMARRGAGTGVR